MRQKLVAVMVASAFAGVAGTAAASTGAISVASIGTYAVEAMGTAISVKVGNVAYTLVSPLAINSTQSLRYALDTTIATCPTASITPAVAGAVPAAPVISADKLSCSYAFAVGTAPVPSGTTVNFVDGTAASSAPLAVDGGKINATVAVLNAGGGHVEGNSVAVATSAQAFTASIVSSAALPLPERSRVDVTTTPAPSLAFTAETAATDVTAPSTTVVNLGRVRFTETPGAQLFSDGTKLVELATATVQNLTVNVSGPFLTEAANGKFSSLQLSTTPACNAMVGTAITGPSSTAANKLAHSIVGVAAVASNKDLFVCYTLPATNNSPVPTGQFTADATVATGITVDADLTDEVVATTNIYNLLLNGTQVDIRNYVPNAFAGWFSAYRIINTGAVAAAVTGQFIGQNGALVGTAQPITASIPAGGVVVLSSAAVEGVLGAASAPGGVGPRLRLTAPTDSLRVQSFACQPAGPCFLNSDAQGADGGGSDK